LYNLDPRYAAKVKENWKFESYAWSSHDSIIKEAMPFKAHFLKTPEAMKNLSQENKDVMKALEKRSAVVKSLGVLTRSDRPDSRATGKAKCQQALMRISQMSLNKVDDKALSIIINSLVVSIAQFAALEANITSAECGKVDRAILNKVRRGFGLSQNDMKNVVFLKHQQLGVFEVSKGPCWRPKQGSSSVGSMVRCNIAPHSEQDGKHGRIVRRILWMPIKVIFWRMA
jgi:hypothetical protein